MYECYATGDFVCHNKWLLGPGIDWTGFNEEITIQQKWLTSTVHNIHICPGDEYACIDQHDGSFTVFGPYMDIEDEYFDFSGLSQLTVSLENSTIKNTVFANGQIEFQSISNVSFENVNFINMTMTTLHCPRNYDFTKSYRCQGEGFYCVNNTIYTLGDTIPPTVNIELACLKGMNIEQTPYRHLMSMSLEGTTLPDDVSDKIFDPHVLGKLTRCPSKTPPGHMCVGNDWISNSAELRNRDITGIDVEFMSFENASWYNVHGIINFCPITSPKNWLCVEYTNKKTFVNEAMFIGQGVDLSKYTHIPDNANVTDVDFKDVVFDGIKRFYGMHGIISRCPKKLPKGYKCYYYDPLEVFIPEFPETWDEHQQYVIIGPYVNVSGLFMNNIYIDEDVNLIGIRGKPYSCPVLSPSMVKKGFFCDDYLTRNYIIGPGVMLDNIDFTIFDDLAAKIPTAKIDFATIGDKLLIEPTENNNNCRMIENRIAETCRNKYTDECSNNLPNYICDTSNLHLGVCSGNCGNNLTSYYSEKLSTTYRTIKTNSVPNHKYHTGRLGDNGFEVCEHYLGIQMPQHPKKSDTFTETCLGPLGILKSGALLYNHLENLQESFISHKPTLDKCNGHADSNCFYHVHNISMELECTHNRPCEHIGYIRDGFPLYSPCQGLKSCYVEQIYSPTADCELDEANGFNFSGTNITDSNGQPIEGYAYVVSTDFPHLPYKYAGEQIFDFLNLNRPQTFIIEENINY